MEITQVETKYTILVKSIPIEGWVQHLIWEVSLFSDGSVFAKEYARYINGDISLEYRNTKGELIRANFKSFDMFADVFPVEAGMIRDYNNVKNSGIDRNW